MVSPWAKVQQKWLTRSKSESALDVKGSNSSNNRHNNSRGHHQQQQQQQQLKVLGLVTYLIGNWKVRVTCNLLFGEGNM